MEMDIKELLDEDAFDPEKLFNEKEYSTLIINRDGFSKKENSSADLIESLLEKELTRQEAEEIFAKIKAAGSPDILVKAIRSAGRTDEKTKLVAAAWECGLDFSADFLLFAELACDDNFQLALEALSVVESTETDIPHDIVRSALEMARQSKSTNTHLISDLIHNLNSRLDG
jgi:hypothetical protein